MSKGKTALKFFGMFDKVDIMAQLSRQKSEIFIMN